jgi:hypothetical protein
VERLRRIRHRQHRGSSRINARRCHLIGPSEPNAAVIVVAVLVPKAAVFGHLVISIAAVWRARGDESPQPGRGQVA